MKLIGLYGLARSGKNTVAGFLEERGYSEASFAHTLKEAARTIFGFTKEQVYGDKKDEVDVFWGFSPRWALQVLGTDCIRNHIGNDVWIKALFKKINLIFARSPESKFVVSDVRFKNEAEAIREAGGVLWKVVRSDHDGLIGVSGSHASEVDLANLSDDYWDGIISAKTGELDWMRTQAFELLEE